MAEKAQTRDQMVRNLSQQYARANSLSEVLEMNFLIILTCFDLMAINVLTTSDNFEIMFFCVALCEKFLYNLIECFRKFFRHFSNKGFSSSQVYQYLQYS